MATEQELQILSGLFDEEEDTEQDIIEPVITSSNAEPLDSKEFEPLNPVTSSEPESSSGEFVEFNKDQFLSDIDVESQKKGINSARFKGLVEQESNFNPQAIGPSTKYGRAKGSTQVIDSMWNAYKGGDKGDPKEQLRVGTDIYKDELERFYGNEDLATAAYNAGAPNVIKAINKAGYDLRDSAAVSFNDIKTFLPLETQDYVTKIKEKSKKYEGQRPIIFQEERTKNASFEEGNNQQSGNQQNLSQTAPPNPLNTVRKYKQNDKGGTLTDLQNDLTPILSDPSFNNLSPLEQVKKVKDIYDAYPFWTDDAKSKIKDITSVFWDAANPEDKLNYGEFVGLPPEIEANDETGSALLEKWKTTQLEQLSDKIDPSFLGNQLDTYMNSQISQEKERADFRNRSVFGDILQAGKAIKRSFLEGFSQPITGPIAGIERKLGFNELADITEAYPLIGVDRAAADFYYETDEKGFIKFDDYGKPLTKLQGEAMKAVTAIGQAAGMAGGITASAALGGPAAAATFAFGSNALSIGNDAYKDTVELGGTKEQAGNAFWLAMPGAALDSVADLYTFGGGKVWVKGLGAFNKAKFLASEIGKRALAEGATESLQQYWQDKAVEFETGKPLASKERTLEAGLLGGFAGGVVAGVTLNAGGPPVSEDIQGKPVPNASTVKEEILTPERIAPPSRKQKTELQAQVTSGTEEQILPPNPEEQVRIAKEFEEFQNSTDSQKVIRVKSLNDIDKDMLSLFAYDVLPNEDGTALITKRQMYQDVAPQVEGDYESTSNALKVTVEKYDSLPNPQDRQALYEERNDLLEIKKGISSIAASQADVVNQVSKEYDNLLTEISELEELRKSNKAKAQTPFRQLINQELDLKKSKLGSLKQVLNKNRAGLKLNAINTRLTKVNNDLETLSSPTFLNDKAAMERDIKNLSLTKELLQTDILEGKKETNSIPRGIQIQTGKGPKNIVNVGSNWYVLDSQGNSLAPSSKRLDQALDYAKGIEKNTNENLNEAELRRLRRRAIRERAKNQVNVRKEVVREAEPVKDATTGETSKPTETTEEAVIETVPLKKDELKAYFKDYPISEIDEDTEPQEPTSGGTAGAQAFKESKVGLRSRTNEKLNFLIRDLAGTTDFGYIGYDPKSRKESLKKGSQQVIKEGVWNRLIRFIDSPDTEFSPEDAAAAIKIRDTLSATVTKLQETNETELADKVALVANELNKKIQLKATNAGQSIDILRYLQNYDPNFRVNTIRALIRGSVEAKVSLETGLTPEEVALASQELDEIDRLIQNTKFETPEVRERRVKLENAVKKVNEQIKERSKHITEGVTQQMRDLQADADKYTGSTKIALLSQISDLERKLGEEADIPLESNIYSYWVLNQLSGLGTHIVNTTGNAVETILSGLSISITDVLKGDPRAGIELMKGFISGATNEGLPSFIAELKGLETFKPEVSKITQDKQISAEGKPRNNDFIKYAPAWMKRFGIGPVTLNKIGYVGRLLSGEDAFFYKAAQEGGARYIAYKQGQDLIKEGKLKQEDLGTYISDTLFNGTEEFNKALAQAKVETETLSKYGIEYSDRDIKRRAWEILEEQRPQGLRSDSHHFAQTRTFNNNPTGVLGKFVDLVEKGKDYPLGVTVRGKEYKYKPFKYIFPFLRTGANLANSYMDLTPIGFLKGTGVIGDLSQIEKQNSLGKAMIGTALAGAVVAFAEEFKDDKDPWFAIYGLGPKDPAQRKQWREQGGRSYSVKLGDKYLIYKDTHFAMLFGALGAYYDKQRFDPSFNRKDPTEYADVILGGTMGSFMNSTFLKSFGDFIGAMQGEPGRSFTESLLISPAKGFVPGAGMLREMAGWFHDPIDTKDSFWAKWASGVPVVQGIGTRSALNVFGEPLERSWEDRIRGLGRFYSQRVDDPTWQWMAKNGYDVSDPTTIELSEKDFKRTFDTRSEKLGADYMHVLTRDEKYELTLKAGPLLKERVSRYKDRYGDIGFNKDIQEKLDKDIRDIRNSVKKEMFLK